MNSKAKSLFPEAMDSRGRILETATQLFAEHGYAGVGMRQVAEQSGLSKSALFHHFPTKLKLYAAVHIRILNQVEAELLRATPAGADPMERLEAWISALVGMFGEHSLLAPLLLRSLFDGEEVDPEEAAEHAAAMGKILGRAHESLKEGMATGRFRQVSVGHTIQTLIGMIVFHFASGDFGDGLMGQSIFAPEQVEKRRRHVINMMRSSLLLDA